MQQQQQLHTGITPPSESEWTESLKMLLDITDGDIEQIYQDGNSKEQSQGYMACVGVPMCPSPQQPVHPQVEIKNPEMKEDFVHPGFYTLSNPYSSQNTFASPTLKRSLQEQEPVDVLNGVDTYTTSIYGHTDSRRHSRSPHSHELDFRRYSVDGQISALASVTPPSPWAYSTPPKTPSLPSSFSRARALTCPFPYLSQYITELPLSQPHIATPSSPVLARFTSYSPTLMTHRQYSSIAQHSSATLDDIHTAPQARKRRASKFYSPGDDPDQLHYSKYTLPPPLQQSHHHQQTPFQSQSWMPHRSRKQAHQEHQHVPKSQRASNGPKVNARGSTYRRNPGEVPASTLPPDHFIFQEAFLKSRLKALPYPVTSMIDDASLSRTQTPVQRHQLELETTQDQPSVEARCQAPMTSSEWPSIPAALSSSTTVPSPSPSWSNPPNSLSETLLVSDEPLLLDVTNVTTRSGQEDADPRKASIVELSPQSESISTAIASNTLEPTEAQAQDPALSAALAFAKCLATATTTLDPASTKLEGPTPSVRASALI
ncbi:hypothetical protein BG011_003824 [Mortierella polycephala]|uniref:Uncharacterized protein n=1 Tax=Mortierella polycephala TaxID=41804 RepID=A0A9P6QCY7_9FUNG|nr:hypothetical protein BG011_003824 [Mortierella polycephala]